MCPICTVTVVAGLGISRLLGIDDIITSIWIGAFILSFSFVTHNWIIKKWPKFKLPYGLYVVILTTYLLVLIPFWLDGVIGIVRNTLWGIDKILLGILVGSFTFLFGVWVDKKVRKLNNNKQFFAYQKVVFPVLALTITSLVFYILVRH